MRQQAPLPAAGGSVELRTKSKSGRVGFEEKCCSCFSLGFFTETPQGFVQNHSRRGSVAPLARCTPFSGRVPQFVWTCKSGNCCWNPGKVTEVSLSTVLNPPKESNVRGAWLSPKKCCTSSLKRSAEASHQAVQLLIMQTGARDVCPPCFVGWVGGWVGGLWVEGVPFRIDKRCLFPIVNEVWVL